MLRLAVDQDFNHHILRALQRHGPELDLILLSEVEMDRAPDEAVLEWAAQRERVLLSHDVNTMRAKAEKRVREGLPMAGVIFTPQHVQNMQALVDDLLLVMECSEAQDWREFPCRFLPFARD